MDSQRCTFPPLYVGALHPFRAIGCLKTVLITASVLIVEIAPRDMRGRDEIGGNRRAGGFFSVGKLAFLRAAAVPASLSSCP